MKLIKTILNKEKGFSLIELVVAVAILFVVIITFTIMYTTSFSGVFRAGHKSQALFEAQDKMDNSIAIGNSNSNEEKVISMKFDSLILDIAGEIIEIEYTYEEREGRLYYFLPK